MSSNKADKQVIDQKRILLDLTENQKLTDHEFRGEKKLNNNNNVK